MKKQFDYTGKAIFVGIDVHKATYCVVTIYDRTIVKKDTIPADPVKLIEYLRKYFKGAKINSAYEAGFSGFSLHRALIESGINNIVVHPGSIEISPRESVKTDKRDATKIACQLSENRLKGVFVPTVEMENRRALTRSRSDCVQEKTRIATKIKQQGNFYGLLTYLDKGSVSKAWLKRLMTQFMSVEVMESFKILIDRWSFINDQIKKLDEKLKIQAEVDSEKEKVYRSFVGIGPKAARILANELGDMSQFSSEKKLFSYTGFVPREHSSGNHRRQGRITKQGKSQLRSTLVQCSWVAIKHDQDLKIIYERIKLRAGSKRAIVAIARRLIGRIRARFRAEAKKNSLCNVKTA